MLRKFKPSDTPELVALFYETVHTVNARDYTQQQLDAWAPMDEKDKKIASWNESLSKHITFVAEMDGVIAGFSDMTDGGYLDRFFIHKDYQGQGVGSALLQRLEQEAAGLQLNEISADVSITAKPFFERHGFRTVRSQSVERNGVMLVNYKMVKKLK